MKAKTCMVVLAAVVALGGLVVFFASQEDPLPAASPAPKATGPKATVQKTTGPKATGPKAIAEVKSDADLPAPPDADEAVTGETEPDETEEERRDAEEERRVDAFDDFVDVWMEPAANGVSMKDVADFRGLFASVPKDRKFECLQRALNLVPDENVLLLAGVLLDKTQDKDLVEMVFNDVLNRDEDVKMPLMREIFKDKTHPCWADVAWIFDVTGEK